MGSSTTNPVTSRESDNPNEEALDWKMWDRACDFWVFLAGGADELKPLRIALGDILDEDGGSMFEKCALVVKAWNLFAANEKLTEKKLELEYHTDDDGIRTLNELPTVGGIDIGNPSEEE